MNISKAGLMITLLITTWIGAFVLFGINDTKSNSVDINTRWDEKITIDNVDRIYTDKNKTYYKIRTNDNSDQNGIVYVEDIVSINIGKDIEVIQITKEKKNIDCLYY